MLLLVVVYIIICSSIILVYIGQSSGAAPKVNVVYGILQVDIDYIHINKYINVHICIYIWVYIYVYIYFGCALVNPSGCPQSECGLWHPASGQGCDNNYNNYNNTLYNNNNNNIQYHNTSDNK